MYIFVSFLNFNLQNIPAKKKKKKKHESLGWVSFNGNLRPRRMVDLPLPAAPGPCPPSIAWPKVAGGGRWWETVGKLGGGLGE